MILLVLKALSIGIVTYYALTLLRNIRIAKQIGVPLLYCPVKDNEIIYIISNYLPWESVKILPARIRNRLIF